MPPGGSREFDGRDAYHRSYGRGDFERPYRNRNNEIKIGCFKGRHMIIFHSVFDLNIIKYSTIFLATLSIIIGLPNLIRSLNAQQFDEIVECFLSCFHFKQK